MSNYKKLIANILLYGRPAKSRAGEALYCFGEAYTTDLNEGFPIVTERKINYKAALGELAGFIRGCTKNSEFKAFGCNYWSAYGEDLGPIYGAQWRNFCGVDQLAELLYNIKNDPESRRLILSTWNPTDLDKMALPPCHILAQFDVHNSTLNQIVYMRSVDIILGLPYDIIVYAGLQALLAQEYRLKLGTLKFFFGNAHIYKNHIETARQLLEEPCHIAPSLYNNNKDVFSFVPEDFVIENYTSGPSLVVPLNL